MKRGTDFEQNLTDDELLDRYSDLLALDDEGIDYWQMVRDFTRELIYRDLLSFAVYND